MKKDITIKFDKVSQSGKEKFNWALNHIQGKFFEMSDGVEDKLVMISFLMNVFRQDIEASSVSRFLYYHDNYYKFENYFLFPTSYYKDDGKEAELIELGNVYVDPLKTCVVSYISEFKSVWYAVINQQENNEHDYSAIYFEEIDVCYVTNGRQKVIGMMHHDLGHIKARRVSLLDMFNHVNTDGESWINAHTGDVLMEVHDFRIAILYELARMKFEIEQ